MQESRQSTREIVTQGVVPKLSFSFLDALDEKTKFAEEFEHTHTHTEMGADALYTEFKVVDGQIIQTIFFEREETDIEWADRIKLKQANIEKAKADLFSKFHLFIMDYPEEARSHLFSLIGPEQVGV
ncbi:MAG: hypothetical protein KAT04_06160 [Methylococcales bacterium]|nr:hypothetical protein [Methylococcales bacterium]